MVGSYGRTSCHEDDAERIIVAKYQGRQKERERKRKK
jgi:hypothetical protein